MSYKRSATLKLVSIIKIRIYYVKMSLEEATFVTYRSGFALLINNQLPGKHMLNLAKKRRRAVYHSTGNVQEVICVVQKELRQKYREGNKQGELVFLFIPSWHTCKTWVCWNSNHFQALAHGVRPSFLTSESVPMQQVFRTSEEKACLRVLFIVWQNM